MCQIINLLCLCSIHLVKIRITHISLAAIFCFILLILLSCHTVAFSADDFQFLSKKKKKILKKWQMSNIFYLVEYRVVLSFVLIKMSLCVCVCVVLCKYCRLMLIAKFPLLWKNKEHRKRIATKWHKWKGSWFLICDLCGIDDGDNTHFTLLALLSMFNSCIFFLYSSGRACITFIILMLLDWNTQGTENKVFFSFSIFFSRCCFLSYCSQRIPFSFNFLPFSVLWSPESGVHEKEKESWWWQRNAFFLFIFYLIFFFFLVEIRSLKTRFFFVGVVIIAIAAAAINVGDLTSHQFSTSVVYMAHRFQVNEKERANNSASFSNVCTDYHYYYFCLCSFILFVFFFVFYVVVFFFFFVVFFRWKKICFLDSSLSSIAVLLQSLHLPCRV